MRRREGARKGFTLVEALIAAALAIIVLGGAIVMYTQGNKMFQATTEHASTREEALLLLERINKDLDSLMVSDEVDPKTSLYYMVQPYKLIQPMPQPGVIDPNTGQPKVEYTGVQFWVYHHTQTIKDPTNDFPLPQLVGQMIEYKLDPIDGDPKKGNNMLRNGVKINKIPLAAVFFRRSNPIYAKGNVGAAPNAVMDVYVIPKGGMWGTMTDDVMNTLLTTGYALMRTFHLVGYESQYTSLLSLAITKGKYQEPLDPLEEAVLADATSNDLVANVKGKIDGSPLEYRLPAGRVVLEQKLFDAATTGDKEFVAAKSEAGDQEQGNVSGSSVKLSAGSQSARLNL